jgi:F0F1-type ATP synthase assembly protein I
MSSEKDGQQKKDVQAAWWQPAIMLSLRLSVWIAGPVLVGVFVGKLLDKKYGTEPWLFLTAVGVAFLISMAGLVMNTMKEYKKIDQESKKAKKQENNLEK